MSSIRNEFNIARKEDTLLEPHRKLQLKPDARKDPAYLESNNFKHFLENKLVLAISEEDCTFCTKRIRRRDWPIVISANLYTKYSNSLNYYYLKNIDQILTNTRSSVSINFNDQKYWNTGQDFFLGYFTVPVAQEKFNNVWKYHQFNIDQPRHIAHGVFLQSDVYFNEKRRVQEKAIKRMLQVLSESELENCEIHLSRFLGNYTDIIENEAEKIDRMVPREFCKRVSTSFSSISRIENKEPAIVKQIQQLKYFLSINQRRESEWDCANLLNSNAHEESNQWPSFLDKQEINTIKSLRNESRKKKVVEYTVPSSVANMLKKEISNKSKKTENETKAKGIAANSSRIKGNLTSSKIKEACTSNKKEVNKSIAQFGINREIVNQINNIVTPRMNIKNESNLFGQALKSSMKKGKIISFMTDKLLSVENHNTKEGSITGPRFHEKAKSIGTSERIEQCSPQRVKIGSGKYWNSITKSVSNRKVNQPILTKIKGTISGVVDNYDAKLLRNMSSVNQKENNLFKTLSTPMRNKNSSLRSFVEKTAPKNKSISNDHKAQTLKKEAYKVAKKSVKSNSSLNSNQLISRTKGPNGGTKQSSTDIRHDQLGKKLKNVNNQSSGFITSKSNLKNSFIASIPMKSKTRNIKSVLDDCPSGLGNENERLEIPEVKGKVNIYSTDFMLSFIHNKRNPASQTLASNDHNQISKSPKSVTSKRSNLGKVSSSSILLKKGYLTSATFGSTNKNLSIRKLNQQSVN